VVKELKYYGFSLQLQIEYLREEEEQLPKMNSPVSQKKENILADK
jgi:hypothetical protein